MDQWHSTDNGRMLRRMKRSGVGVNRTGQREYLLLCNHTDNAPFIKEPIKHLLTADCSQSSFVNTYITQRDAKVHKYSTWTMCIDYYTYLEECFTSYSTVDKTLLTCIQYVIYDGNTYVNLCKIHPIFWGLFGAHFTKGKMGIHGSTCKLNILVTFVKCTYMWS